MLTKVPPRFVADNIPSEHESLSYQKNPDGSVYLSIGDDVRDDMCADDLCLRAIIETGNSDMLNPTFIPSSSIDMSDNVSDQISNLLNVSSNE